MPYSLVTRLGGFGSMYVSGSLLNITCIGKMLKLYSGVLFYMRANPESAPRMQNFFLIEFQHIFPTGNRC